jgi:DnaD/phage-associated family protein
MKRTWIKIKRGLLAPKHRDKLGIRVWLFMYMLDICDWETGKILEWRDKEAALDMQMPWRTLQQQRQKLAEDDYISCVQKGDKQVITILKWTNPREYSGEVYNPTGGGTENYVPTGGDTQSYVPPEGTNEGTNEGISKPSTLPIRSHITDHTFGRWCSVYESEIGGLTGMIGDEIELLVGEYPEDWFEEAVKIAVENNVRKLSYVKGILKRWEVEGKDNGSKKTEEKFVEWS